MDWPDTTGAPQMVEWRGRRFYFSERKHGGYYYPSRKLEGEATRPGLHQELFRARHGAIPSGCVVHHKDGNSLNNDPSNLEAKQRSQHLSDHMFEAYEDPEYRAAVAAGLAKAQLAAAEWHGSEEGRAWHSRNAQAMWSEEGRAQLQHERTCIECGDTFTAHMQDARFCTMRCFQRVAARDGRYKITKTCPVCEVEFTTSRHRVASACSVPCRWEVRRRRMRGEMEWP